MSQDKLMTLFFNDGSKLSFSFPEQESNAMAKKLKFNDIIAGNQLVIESDGDLLMFPMASIKYVQFSGVNFGAIDPAQLPKIIIQGASLLG